MAPIPWPITESAIHCGKLDDFLWKVDACSIKFVILFISNSPLSDLK